MFCEYVCRPDFRRLQGCITLKPHCFPSNGLVLQALSLLHKAGASSFKILYIGCDDINLYSGYFYQADNGCKAALSFSLVCATVQSHATSICVWPMQVTFAGARRRIFRKTHCQGNGLCYLSCVKIIASCLTKSIRLQAISRCLIISM